MKLFILVHVEGDITLPKSIVNNLSIPLGEMNEIRALNISLPLIFDNYSFLTRLYLILFLPYRQFHQYQV